MEKQEQNEQIIRNVKLFGNGAHIFVPKEWVGEQIVLIRQPKKKINERILDILKPYLNNIIGVYLYGSYAREEQEEDSDIDLLVITDKKIKIKEKGFEIVCIEENKLDDAIKIEPLLIYSMLSEAKPIINSRLLENLKVKYAPKLKNFHEFLDSTEKFIKINEDYLSKEGEFVSGDAEIYSIVLRLRGVFIIKQLLKNEKYSHKKFKEWIKNVNSKIDFDSIYNIYRKSKLDLKHKEKVKKNDLIILLNFLKKEVSSFKD